MRWLRWQPLGRHGVNFCSQVWVVALGDIQQWGDVLKWLCQGICGIHFARDKLHMHTVQVS